MRKKVFSAILLISLFITPYANSVEGEIRDNKVSLRDLIQNHTGNQDSGDYTQPVDKEYDEGPVNASGPAPKNATRANLQHVPCASSEASDNKVIAPPDAPGVVTDPTTGLPYLCLAKTSETEPVAYELPDGTVVEAPEPIIVTVEDMKNLGLLAAASHQERAPHTLKNYHTNFWVDPNPQNFNTTIGGVPVEVRATPINYTYHYGDGSTNNQATSQPGTSEFAMKTS